MKQRKTTTLSETISNSCGDTRNLYGILTKLGGFTRCACEKANKKEE
jgi:hypothetical protein